MVGWQGAYNTRARAHTELRAAVPQRLTQSACGLPAAGLPDHKHINAVLHARARALSPVSLSPSVSLAVSEPLSLSARSETLSHASAQLRSTPPRLATHAAHWHGTAGIEFGQFPTSTLPLATRGTHPLTDSLTVWPASHAVIGPLLHLPNDPGHHVETCRGLGSGCTGPMETERWKQSSSVSPQLR